MRENCVMRHQLLIVAVWIGASTWAVPPALAQNRTRSPGVLSVLADELDQIGQSLFGSKVPANSRSTPQMARPQPATAQYGAGHDQAAGARAGRVDQLDAGPGGVDLRGWRVTDNDNKTATDEGSLIFPDHPAFASVPRGTFILIIATKTANNDARYPQDDLKVWDRRLVLYAGNGHLDIDSDPWFNLGARDNLALLAPGPTESWADDQGIAFLSTSPAVTPASFGVLVDGLTGAE